jgi:hypothetical protein
MQMSEAIENQAALDAVPSQLSDYSHYTFHEEHDGENPDGVPVYQSKSTGMLFTEDGTPLMYYEGRLLKIVELCEVLSTEEFGGHDTESILLEMRDRREQFSRVLEADRAS